MVEIVAAEIVERSPASSPDVLIPATRSLARELVAILLAACGGAKDAAPSSDAAATAAAPAAKPDAGAKAMLDNVTGQ